MAKKIQLQDANGNVLHPLTLGECVAMDSGENLDTLMSKSQMFTPTITQDKSMFKVGTGVDVDYSANVKDGAYESLVFKGKSLVNIIDYNKRGFNEGNTLDSGVVTINHRGGSYSNTFFLTPDNIKPSTDYFVIFNVISNTYENHIKLMSDDDKACCFDCSLTIQAKTTGLYKMKVTSKSDLSSCRFLLRTFGYNNTNNGSCQYRVMVIEYIEGMENWDIPYFEGLCDSKMPILRNIGKNLLDPQTFIPLDKGAEYVRYEDGYVLANFTNANTHFFYKVDLARLPKGMYTVIAKHEGERSYLGIQHTFKDGTKTWGKTQFNNDGSYAELGLYMQSTTNDPSLKVKAKIMLVANGDTTSPYEDYKTNILRTSEEIVLREVGGVCDTYNPLTGEYVRRIGEIALDGSDNETWGNYEVKGDNVKFAYYPTLVAQGSYQFVECLCDKWKADSQANETIQEQISLYNHMSNNTPQTEVRITVSPTRLQSVDVTGFRAWLSQNPLTVQYILAEPVTTIVKPSTMTPFAYQNGHAIVESGFEGQSLLPEIEYSVVTGRTGQVTQNTKVLRKQEQQIIGLEELLLTQVVQMEYERTLLQFDYELQMMMLG